MYKVFIKMQKTIAYILVFTIIFGVNYSFQPINVLGSDVTIEENIPSHPNDDNTTPYEEITYPEEDTMYPYEDLNNPSEDNIYPSEDINNPDTDIDYPNEVENNPIYNEIFLIDSENKFLENNALFTSTPSYVLDFSNIEESAVSNRQTVPAGSLITDMPGVTLNIDTEAKHQNFNMTPAGGTVRASGSSNNTFIDPNGQNRRLESTVELTGPIRVVITGRTTLANNLATATFNFGGQSITHNVNDNNSKWTTVTFDFPNGSGILSLDWPWTSTNRLGIQRIEIFEGSEPSFSTSSTYHFDFSNISKDAASSRQTVAPAMPVTNISGVRRTIDPSAREQNFNMVPVGGTIRASGSGNNTFIDPNGQNRRLESNVELEGPLRVKITGRSTVANSMATATLNFGGHSITHNITNSNSAWSTATFDFPDGRGILSLDWPWTATNRLGVQRIEIYEGVHNSTFSSTPSYILDFSRISSEAAANRQTVSPASLITTLPGVKRNVAQTASNSNFNLVPSGGTIRASGTGNNTFIDPNGQNRKLQSTVELSGPIRVVITGRTTLNNNMATATVNYGGHSITQNVNNSSSQWSTTTFDFPDGRGIVSIDLPWTSTNRLGIQHIEIFEENNDNGSTVHFPVIEYRDLNNQPASWYGTDHSRLIADNLMVMQRNNGGWPRGTGQGGINFPTNLATMTDSEKQYHNNNKHLIDSYYGRGITSNETRYLLTMYEATGNVAYRDSAMRGFNAIINSQYSNGGWPYYVTDRSLYRSTISFKDNAIPDIMDLLRDISNGVFPSVSSSDRNRAKIAFDNGLNAILNLQNWYDASGNHLGRNWTENARMGGWAANSHDVTMNPRWAREFEPPSIGVWETVRVLDFLMTIENPSIEIQRAIHGGVELINYLEIFNYNLTTVSGNRVLQQTSGARGLWPRFVCVETLVPLFYDRKQPRAHATNPPANQWLGVLSSQDIGGVRQDSTGGIRRNLNTNGGIYVFNSNQQLDLAASYANISHERRNGYQYIGVYGNNLQSNYNNWKQNNGIRY